MKVELIVTVELSGPNTDVTVTYDGVTIGSLSVGSGVATPESEKRALIIGMIAHALDRAADRMRYPSVQGPTP